MFALMLGSVCPASMKYCHTPAEKFTVSRSRIDIAAIAYEPCQKCTVIISSASFECKHRHLFLMLATIHLLHVLEII